MGLAMQGMRIPLGSIWRISKVAKNTLLIHSKDFRPNVRFRFASKNLARHWHDVRRRTHSPPRVSLLTGSDHLCPFSSLTSSSSFSDFAPERFPRQGAQNLCARLQVGGALFY